MPKKVLYVAGKYRDSRGAFYVEENIYKAKVVAVELWRMGFAAIWPHGNTMYFEGAVEMLDILQGDLDLVRLCDGLVMTPGWESSEGAKGEWRAAYGEMKPIFYWDLAHDRESLRRWARDDFNVVTYVKLQRMHEDPKMLDHMPNIRMERKYVPKATIDGSFSVGQDGLGAPSCGVGRPEGSQAS